MTYQGLFGAFVFTVTEFEICTFRDLNRKREFVFAAHETLNDSERLQHTGRKLDEMSLTAIILPLGDALSTVNARLRILDLLVEDGEEWPLVIGMRYYGKHVLTGYEVTHRIIHFGVTLSAEVKMNFREYQ